MSDDQQKPKMDRATSLRRYITAAPLNDLTKAMLTMQVSREMLADIVACCDKAIEQDGALDPATLKNFITESLAQLDAPIAEKAEQQ